MSSEHFQDREHIMIQDSRLYTFLDKKHRFSLNFFDGQKLIHDLALTHPLKSSAFAYFRDALLGVLPTISYLKHGESLGFYLDSETPYFRLKVETNSHGHTRTLLLPESFSEFPLKLSGVCRVTKQFPTNKSPYTSVIEFENSTTTEIINEFLKKSFQSQSLINISEASDQSFKLALLPQETTVQNELSLKALGEELARKFSVIYDDAPNDVESVVKLIEPLGFEYLNSKKVEFFCPCSKEETAAKMATLFQNRLDELFEQDQSIEIKCDYCKKSYLFFRDDLEIKLN